MPMFAVKCVQPPSNASKNQSGTRADFERQGAKIERAAEAMLARHRSDEECEVEPSLATKYTIRRERLLGDVV